MILADEDFAPGGRLNAETLEVGRHGRGRLGRAGAVAELSAMDNVRVMPRTTVYGAYDHGIYGALERCTDHLAESGGKPRQILWRIYSKRAVLAAGATERPIAFGNNDRPGVMLAGAVRAYVNRFGVTPGHHVAVFHQQRRWLAHGRRSGGKGVEVTAVIDSRGLPRRFVTCPVRGMCVARRCGYRGPQGREVRSP